LLGGRVLEFRSLNESTNLWWEFFDTIDQTVNLAPRGCGDLNYRKPIKISIQKASKDRRYLRENSSWEKPRGRERKFTIVKVKVNFTKFYCGYNILDPSLSFEENIYLY